MKDNRIKMNREEKEKRVVDRIIRPMFRLLCFYEISECYSYLPGIDDSADYAWAFYEATLKDLHKYIDSSKDLTEGERTKLLEIYSDIEGIIIDMDSIDTLISHWCAAEPRLVTMSNRARLYSGLKEEGAFDMMQKLGFDWEDFSIDILRSSVNQTQDSLIETKLLLNTYLKKVIDVLGSFDPWSLLKAISNSLDYEQNCRLSTKEIRNAKQAAANIDYNEMREEGLYRLNLLREHFGEFELAYDERRIKSLQREKSVYAYGIISEENADYYLVVDPARLYWKLHRDSTFVQCYKEHATDSGFCHVPVEVREGKLRVVKEWL